MSEKPKRVSVPIIREYDDKTPILYANDSWVGHTKWEIQVSFGHILPFPPMADSAAVPSEIKIRPNITVVMTFEHAEAFLKALAAQVEKVKKLKELVDGDQAEEPADEA